MKTGIFVNPARPENKERADKLAALLTARAIENKAVKTLCREEIEDLGVLLVLGGDGTILRCAEICARTGVKIVGVNYGTLGFLTEFEKDELEKIPEFLLRAERGETKEVKRNLLKITYREKVFYCLNEAAVRRDYSLKNGEMLKTEIFVNGCSFDEVSGDGALVCTPTGSTAYSLSAGGPIIAPQTAAILFTPLCAFSLAARPAVLPQTDRVTIKIIRGGAFLLIDGSVAAQAEEGDEIAAESSEFIAAFPTRSFGGFYKKARKKLS